MASVTFIAARKGVVAARNCYKNSIQCDYGSVSFIAARNKPIAARNKSTGLHSFAHFDPVFKPDQSPYYANNITPFH
jgi:hypothetical protein